MIIVTGADNTGKTTLVEALSKHFDLPKLERYQPLPPEDYQEFSNYILENLHAMPVAIADRFYFDELVYGPLKRGKIQYSGTDQAKMMELINSSTNLLVILAHATEETMEANWDEREQYVDLRENLKAQSMFGEILEQYNVPVLMYNYAIDPDASGVIEAIKDLYPESTTWREE